MRDKHMLLVEASSLLRRTVALTARSMHLATVHEVASATLALSLLQTQRFDGAVIAIDGDSEAAATALALLDQVRAGLTASDSGIPVAVMLEHCDAAMLRALQARAVTRVMLKPFKAHALLDTFAAFADAAPPP
jgi:DNA-binding NarL/FixJ family response regulator